VPDFKELHKQCVAETAAAPLAAHNCGIGCELGFVPIPHPYSGVISPTGPAGLVIAHRHAKAQKNLFALDSLFSEPFIIQHRSRFAKVRDRQECLH
jgi:hypothetical protein